MQPIPKTQFVPICLAQSMKKDNEKDHQQGGFKRVAYFSTVNS